MADILARIVASKQQEIAEQRERTPLALLEAQLSHAPRVRDFRSALEQGHGMAIIAEVKKASPSAGVLRVDFDPVAIARIYQAHGAQAISVLTDAPFFQGALDYLTAIRAAVALPVLRKDFILDPYQVVQARAAGADAVLLIAEILDDAQLASLRGQVEELGMQALVELYDPANAARVVRAGAKIIGVNNRNLRTFATDLDHTLQVAKALPQGCCLVSESGIRTAADLERLRAGGARAVLVGETLMHAPDIGAKLRELRGP